MPPNEHACADARQRCGTPPSSSSTPTTPGRFPRRPRARLMLPLATDYADYEQRFADALRAIGIVSNWSADELLFRIISTNADLLFIRLDQGPG
jgi:hypothetical protein